MRLIATLSSLVTLPAVVAHEATHAALTAPHAAEWDFYVSLAGAGVVVDEWRDTAPRWGVVLAHLGPLICGTLLGLLALLYIATVGYDPQGYDWLKVSVLAVWWGIYTAPSGGDLAVLDGGDDDAAE